MVCLERVLEEQHGKIASIEHVEECLFLAHNICAERLACAEKVRTYGRERKKNTRNTQQIYTNEVQQVVKICQKIWTHSARNKICTSQPVFFPYHSGSAGSVQVQFNCHLFLSPIGAQPIFFFKIRVQPAQPPFRWKIRVEPAQHVVFLVSIILKIVTKRQLDPIGIAHHSLFLFFSSFLLFFLD